MKTDPTALWATWPPESSLQPAGLARPVEARGSHPNWTEDGVKSKAGFEYHRDWYDAWGRVSKRRLRRLSLRDAEIPDEHEPGQAQIHRVETWPTDRVQVGLQVLLLKAHGYYVPRAVIYRATERRRVGEAPTLAFLTTR